MFCLNAVVCQNCLCVCFCVYAFVLIILCFWCVCVLCQAGVSMLCRFIGVVCMGVYGVHVFVVMLVG